jgi:hypothetical protein
LPEHNRQRQPRDGAANRGGETVDAVGKRLHGTMMTHREGFR